MKKRIIVFVGLFSFFYVDITFNKRSYFDHRNTAPIEFSNEKEKLKRKKRKYKNTKYTRRRDYRHKSFKLRGTHSKDSRYSNQKDIRRMHTSYA